jgi:nucleoid-associated protein YgaU
MIATVQRHRHHHVAVRRAGAGAPAGPAAMVARRRRWLAGAAAVGAFSVLGLGAHGVLSGPGDVPASAAGAGPAPSVQTVKVEAGDTLWAIGERHHGDVPIQRYVDRLVELNGGTTAIAAGQLVRLP